LDAPAPHVRRRGEREPDHRWGPGLRTPEQLLGPLRCTRARPGRFCSLTGFRGDRPGHFGIDDSQAHHGCLFGLSSVCDARAGRRRRLFAGGNGSGTDPGSRSRAPSRLMLVRPGPTKTGGTSRELSTGRRPGFRTRGAIPRPSENGLGGSIHVAARFHGPLLRAETSCKKKKKTFPVPAGRER